MSNDRIKRDVASLWPWIAAGILLSLALGVGAYLFFRAAAPPEQGPALERFQAITSVAGPKSDVKLYFPSKEGDLLVAEEREVPESPDVNVMARAVVEELIRGPSGGLTPSLPQGARVKSLYIDESGTAYVNFSRELQSEFPGGAWTETLTIYSLVNTLTANFPEDITAVQILVEGAEIKTLAGHIDTSRPFLPRTALNKG